MARFLDAAGQPIGDAFDLVAPDPLKVFFVKSAPAPDGSFLVARLHGFSIPFACTPGNELLVDHYSVVGAQVSSRFFLGEVSDADFHVRSDGTGIVSANGSDPCGHRPTTLYGGKVSAQDSEQISLLGFNSAYTGTGSSVIPLSDGGVGAFQLTSYYASGVARLYYQRMGVDGVMSNSIALTTATSASSFPVAAEPLSDGNLAVIWSLPSGGGSEVHVVVLTPDGSIVREETRAWSSPVSDVSVTAMSNGTFVAAWQVESSTAGGAHAVITTQRYALSGAPLEGPQQAVDRPTVSGGVQAGRGFSLSAGADGHFLLAFMRAAASGAVVDVIGR